jgi:hypothetical protein
MHPHAWRRYVVGNLIPHNEDNIPAEQNHDHQPDRHDHYKAACTRTHQCTAPCLRPAAAGRTQGRCLPSGTRLITSSTVDRSDGDLRIDRPSWPDTSSAICTESTPTRTEMRTAASHALAAPNDAPNPPDSTSRQTDDRKLKIERASTVDKIAARTVMAT